MIDFIILTIQGSQCAVEAFTKALFIFLFLAAHKARLRLDVDVEIDLVTVELKVLSQSFELRHVEIEWSREP